jgi:AsmA protein
VRRPTDTAGKETQKPPTRLPIETLRKLNVHGTVQIGSATFAGLVFTGVTLPVAAADGRVRLGPAQAHLLGGVYDGDTVLDARLAQAQLSLNEHVKGMDVGAFMKQSLDTTRVSGHGDANAILAGVGNTDTDILRSLNGKIDVNVKEGAINGIDLWYELRRARAVVKRDAVPARTGPERTVFNTFSGSGTLARGILKNDDLSIETDYLKVHGGGTLDLGAKTIDYRVVAQLYKLPPEGAGSELKDLKAADIPFTLTGSLQNMALRPDIEAFAKGQLRQEVNQKLQGKQDELKKKLGDKLRDLLGR